MLENPTAHSCLGARPAQRQKSGGRRSSRMEKIALAAMKTFGNGKNLSEYAQRYACTYRYRHRYEDDILAPRASAVSGPKLWTQTLNRNVAPSTCTMNPEPYSRTRTLPSDPTGLDTTQKKKKLQLLFKQGPTLNLIS